MLFSLAVDLELFARKCEMVRETFFGLAVEDLGPCIAVSFVQLRFWLKSGSYLEQRRRADGFQGSRVPS